MYYSTYRYVTVIVYIVVFGLMALFVSLQSLVFGIVFIITFTIIGVLGTWIHFSLTEERLDEYKGRIPMPNLGLGMWGFDIVDDDVGYSGAPPSDYAPDYDSNELDQHPFALHCPFCHSPLARSNAKFCDECGKPVTSAPVSKNPDDSSVG